MVSRHRDAVDVAVKGVPCLGGSSVASSTRSDWTEVLESVEPKVKAITPTTIHFAEKTMEAMCAYEESIQKMDTDFRNDKCFTLECGSEDAFKLLDKYAKDFEKELKTLEHNANLCAVFEFPEKIDTARGILETMIQLIDDQRDAWAVEDVAGFIGTCSHALAGIGDRGHRGRLEGARAAFCGGAFPSMRLVAISLP